MAGLETSLWTTLTSTTENVEAHSCATLRTACVPLVSLSATHLIGQDPMEEQAVSVLDRRTITHLGQLKVSSLKNLKDTQKWFILAR